MVPTKKALQPLQFIQPWISSATTLTTGKPFHRSMLLLTWMQQIQGRLIFIRMGPDLGPWIDLLLLRQWTKMQLSVADKWNHHMLSSRRGFSFPFEAVGEEGVASGQGADETSRFQRPNSSRGQAAFLIWRYHAQQVLLQCCPFASQSRWVLITGEEPWPLASQAPATKCLLRTVALGPTPQPALTWSLLYPPQALRMLQSHSSQGARSWRPKRKSFYSVLRKWITIQCTGIAKIRGLDFGWSTTQLAVTPLIEEMSLRGMTSLETSWNISPWLWSLLVPTKHLCTSAPAVNPQRGMAASSLHKKRGRPRSSRFLTPTRSFSKWNSSVLSLQPHGL